MEIKGVVDEERKKYPKINQINKKSLKKNIPSKWAKIGITSFIVTMAVKNNVFAISPDEIAPSAGEIETPTAGVAKKEINMVLLESNIIPIILGILILLTGGLMVKAKVKAKKNNEQMKVKRWILIVFGISIVALIVFFILRMTCCS